MMLKSAIFATVLTGMAVAGAGGASAWTRGNDGWRDHGRHRAVLHTSVQCVRGLKVLVKTNYWGRVVSRSVIGRCGPTHRHAWGRW